VRERDIEAAIEGTLIWKLEIEEWRRPLVRPFGARFLSSSRNGNLVGPMTQIRPPEVSIWQ
jgi:hypothetical protein